MEELDSGIRCFWFVGLLTENEIMDTFKMIKGEKNEGMHLCVCVCMGCEGILKKRKQKTKNWFLTATLLSDASGHTIEQEISTFLVRQVTERESKQ